MLKLLKARTYYITQSRHMYIQLQKKNKTKHKVHDKCQITNEDEFDGVQYVEVGEKWIIQCREFEFFQ